VSNFVTQALSGEPLSVYGDGSQTRSFCYVDDLVRGLVAMLDSDATGPINLGHPVEQTVISLAELVLELTAAGSPIVSQPLPVDDPVRRCPDISRARQMLRWQPTTDIRVGLDRTIKWFLSQGVAEPHLERARASTG
jgi:dTDP-glucose 4,6-dehydratase